MAQPERSSERQLFGFGQFVLLLCLTPFILSMTLFTFGDKDSPPSQYSTDTERFVPLDFPATISVPGHSIGMESIERASICNGPLGRSEMLRKPCSEYRERLKRYERHKATILAKPPEMSTPPTMKVVEKAAFSFNALVEQLTQLSSLQLISTPLWLLGMLLIFPCIWLGIRKRQWGLLVFALAVPSYNYLLAFLSLLAQSPVPLNWQFNSPFFAQLAFLWFVIYGHTRTRSFVLFIVLLLLSISLPVMLNSQFLQSFNYLAEDSYSLFNALLPIVIFMLATVLGRLLVLGAIENWRQIHRLGLVQTLRSACHAFVLWLPMLLIAIPVLFLTEVALPKLAINQLHKDKVLIFDNEHDLLDNVLQSVAVKADEMQFAWYVAVERARIEIREKHEQVDQARLENLVSDAFAEVVPPDLKFSEPDSNAPLVGWLVNLAAKESQKSAQKTYQRYRSEVESNLRSLVRDQSQTFKQQILNPATDKSLAVADSLYQRGQSQIQERSRQAQASLWWILNTTRAIHQITILLFILVCIKSYLYVFARVTFHRHSGALVTLGPSSDPGETPDAAIHSTGQQYLISADQAQTMYISRRFQCRGKPPRYALPQPFASLFSRIFSRNLSMNKVVMRDDDLPVSLTATQGLEFFEWQLQPGESVIFHYANFVGFSDEIKLNTLVSPRISSLLLGGIVFSQATGPGKLILMAKGRAEISQGNDGSLPPERLIAMQTKAAFHVESELDLVNIYISSAYVSPARGHAIVDVDTQRGARSGVSTFLKQFILPF